jgi:hypothetical protein
VEKKTKQNSLKTIKTTKKAHTALKKYCKKNKLIMSAVAEKLILEGVKKC